MADNRFEREAQKVIDRRKKNSKTPKGDTRKYEPRICSVCGNEFTPKSSRASLCKECKLGQWVENIMFGIDD